MSEASADQSILPMTRERLKSLDPEFWTEERLDQQMNQWSYTLPPKAEDRIAHARKWSA